MKSSIKVEGGNIVAGLDTNQDGENSLSLKLSINEAIQEGLAALKKGEKKEVSVDAKKVDIVFEGSTIKLKIDTDGDGESLLELELDMVEVLDEAAGSLLG